MALVVYSNRALGELEAHVADLFGQIRNQDIGPVVYADKPKPFTKNELQKIRRIKTVSKSRKLVFNFFFPSLRDEFRSDPLKVVSFLVGHEGSGSLLSHLIQRKWALELMSYSDNVADMYTIFAVHITLTEKGLAEYEQVVHSVFQYIAMLRREGLSKALFREIQTLSNMSFEFQSKQAGVHKAISLAGLLSQCPPELVNKYHHLMEEFRPDRFSEVVEQLVPANLILELRNHQLEGLPLTEPIYGTEYSFEPMQADLVGRINALLAGRVGVTLDAKGEIASDLGMPEPNLFIPEDFSILHGQKETSDLRPRMVYSTENSELFFLPDVQFNLPKLLIKANLFLAGDALFAEPKQYLSLTLFSSGLKEYLREFIYMAQMAKIDISLVPTKKGLKFKASGFNHKFQIFLRELSRRIADFALAEGAEADFIAAKFATLKLKRLEELENQLKLEPYNQYGMTMSEAVTTGSFGHDALIGAIKDLSLEEYLGVHREVLRRVYVETLISGNLTEKDAVDIQRNLIETLQEKRLSQSLALVDIRENRLVGLAAKSVTVFERALRNESDSNNLVGVEFQLPQDPRHKYVNMLLEDYLSSLYFEELRTNQQVGYVVFAVKSLRSQTPGFIFLIQSSRFLPSELAEKTYSFLAQQRSAIRELTDKKFEEIREGKLAENRQDFNSLGAQSGFYFGEIDNHNYDFEKKRVTLDALKSLTKKDLLEHFERLFFEEQRVLEVHMSCPKDRDRNREHLEKRQLAEDSGFGGLAVEVFQCPKKLKNANMLYRDASLKTRVYEAK